MPSVARSIYCVDSSVNYSGFFYSRYTFIPLPRFPNGFSLLPGRSTRRVRDSDHFEIVWVFNSECQVQDVIALPASRRCESSSDGFLVRDLATRTCHPPCEVSSCRRSASRGVSPPPQPTTRTSYTWACAAGMRRAGGETETCKTHSYDKTRFEFQPK